MSKKILALVLALSMLATLCLCTVTASAANPESPWAALDLEAFAAGTDANWVTSSKGVAVETIGSYTGITATDSSAANGMLKTYDPAFIGDATSAETAKRSWGYFKSPNTITTAETDSYVVEFKHTMGAGAYSMDHGGLYFYPRTSGVGNYLDNRFAIMMRRNHLGVVQIGLKPATSKAAVNSSWLNVETEGIDLLNASIRIVDNYNTNIIKVYYTNTEGAYKLVGTYTVDPATKTVVLAADSGKTVTATGYSNSISATSTTPIFLLNEYCATVSDVVVSYPYTGPQGLTVDPAPGAYFYDALELAFTPYDEDGMIYYTVDGTDPIENEDGRLEYYEGDYVDLNPDGLDLPLTVTVKAVEELNGEYSDVQSYDYLLIDYEGSFGINYDDVLEGTDANWTFGQSVTPVKYSDESTYNDAIALPDTDQWTYLGSKFKIPAVAGSSVMTFDVKNMQDYGDTNYIRAIHLSFKSSKALNATTNAVPYLTIGAKTVGLREDKAWGSNVVTRIPFGTDLNLADGETHNVEFRDYFDGDAYLFIDGEFIAKAAVEGNVITLTNAIGQTAVRNVNSTPLEVGTDNFVSNFNIMHNTATVGEIEVSYPAPELEELAVAEIDAEDAQLFTGFDSFDINVNTTAGDIYYTLDGTMPNENSEVSDGTITIESTDEAGEITVIVRPCVDGVWGIGDTVTFTVTAPAEEITFDFNDDSYLESWTNQITAGGTKMFTQTEDGKLLSSSSSTSAGWTMANLNYYIESGMTNTLAFDLQDLDANPDTTNDDWLPLGVAVRHLSPTNWFNDASSHTGVGVYIMFNQNKLGLRLDNTKYNAQEGYSFVEVDADFANETRVIIKDAVENNLIGVYVQDTAGTTDPELIACLTIEELGSDVSGDGNNDLYVSLYSTLGGSVEDVVYGTGKYSTEKFMPIFMANAYPGSYSIDNVTITKNNVETEAIETPILGPVFTEVETGSDYYKFVEIEASAAGGTEVYYTLDGTEPSNENGVLLEDGAYVLITKDCTLSAIAYDATYGGSSEVVTEDYTVAEFEYYEYPFDGQALLDGTDKTWKQASNNNNSRPSFYMNEDGSFTLDGRNKGDYTGGVGAVMTTNSLTSTTNPVSITEFDAKNWSTRDDHMSVFIGLRHGNNHATSMTDNNLFFIRLNGTKIGFKNQASWGTANVSALLETGAAFTTAASDFQHYTIIDDKINNVVKVLGNGHLLGTYTFSTTTNSNDTVTLTTPAGNSDSRTYKTSIAINGQTYIGQAYTNVVLKDLVTYSGTVVPEYEINFDAGTFGTISGDSTINVPKYSAITNVPAVTTEFTFVGWTQDGGVTILSDDEVAAIVPTGAMTFTAVYSGISIDNYTLVPSVVGTSPVFVDSFPLNGVFEDDYSVYYTIDGSEPTAGNAILWDGKFLKFENDAVLQAYATANGYSTEVFSVEITVNDNEYWYDILDNEAIAADYGDTDRNSTDGKAFNHTSNRTKDDEGNIYPKTLYIQEDGSLHIDSINYGNGTGVSTTYPAENRWDSSLETAETMVYSFDVRNADDYAINAAEPGKVHRAMQLGVRVPSDAGYGALVNDANPQMLIANGKVGMKFGKWGSTASAIWAENVPENMADISGDEWVNITIVDDRTTNIIKLFVDDVLAGTYTVDGANFTLTDVAGKSYTVTYAKDIESDGLFYIGAAYYSFDLDNFDIRTGTIVPEFDVTFNVGDNGVTSDKTGYTYTKYEKITEVPEVTPNAYYTFNGWTKNDETKVYSDLEIIEMAVTGETVFTANYTLNYVDANVTVESITAEKGKLAKTTLKVESEADLSGYVTVAFDDSLVEFDDTNSDTAAVDNGDGTVTVTLTGANSYALTFKMLDDTIGIETALQICDYELEGAENEPLAVNVTDGTIITGVLKGDANQNGKIDIYDAVAVLKSIAGIETLESDAFASADVVADGELTLSDATAILKYIARIIATF